MVELQVVNCVVTQDEIEAVIGIQNQIRHLKHIRRRRRQELLARLIAGATVEQGTHIAEMREKQKDGVRVTRLKIR